MRKSATVPISGWSGPAPVSLAKHVHLALHMCTTRQPRSSPTGVQHEDGGAGPSRHLHGRPGSRLGPGGHRRHDGSTAPLREFEDTACTPSSAASPTNRGTLHCSRIKLQTSCYWTVARAPVGCVRLSPAASCAEAFCGHFGAPRDFTSAGEQYAKFCAIYSHNPTAVM